MTCGDTQIASGDLQIAIRRTGDKEFANQFMVSPLPLSPLPLIGQAMSLYIIIIMQVLDQVSPRPEEVIANFAAKNPDQNRSHDFLPGTTFHHHTLLITLPTHLYSTADEWRVHLKGEHPDYINAVYINVCLWFLEV